VMIPYATLVGSTVSGSWKRATNRQIGRRYSPCE
jgi:hypothetical protein